MKKGYSVVLATLGILFAVYNVIVFVLPIPRTAAFWVAYLFTTLAILLQIGISYIAFKNNNQLKSIFLGLPTANVGGIYLFLQLVWGAIVMVLPVITPAIAVVVSVVLLGWCLTSVIMTAVSRDVIASVDEKVKEKTSFIKSNQIAVELLIGKAEDDDLKKKLTGLRDAIRYSDPMSDASVARLEAEIEVQIADLKAAVGEKNPEKTTQLVAKLQDLITERNQMVKLSK